MIFILYSRYMYMYVYMYVYVYVYVYVYNKLITPVSPEYPIWESIFFFLLELGRLFLLFGFLQFWIPRHACFL